MALSELYQQVIMDHGRKPRNYGRLARATHRGHGYNPLCGDEIRVEVCVVDGRLAEVGFEGCGCAISQASASMMTQAVSGRSVDEALALQDRFRRGLVEGDALPEEIEELGALAGVRAFPNRVKCATLAWHALRQALEGDNA